MDIADLFDDFARVTVSQYTAQIKKLLEGRMLPCWVIGEVSNLRRQSSGHLYFSLKDAGAQLPAVMFRGQAHALSFRPTDGMEVLAFGEISVYEPHGRYQLIVREMRESGPGRLFREFERLKRKLLEEGLFARERKRPLPVLPLRVAIVTSPSGAALQDFVRILKRRGWGGQLTIIPVRVQGKGAAEEIVEGIELANRMAAFDLLVVGRGGGSIEDLWAFNEESVARAVSSSSIPVISGVGHETDVTLSDFAADARAETPSAAAEIISSSWLASIERMDAAREELEAALGEGLLALRSRLDALRSTLRILSPKAKLEKEMLRLDEIGSRFISAWQSAIHERRKQFVLADRRFGALNLRRMIHVRDEWIAELSKRLERRLEAGLSERRRSLDLAGATLRAISPEATLKRGFAILETAEGEPLTSVKGIAAGDRVSAALRDGSLELDVRRVGLSKGPEKGG